MQSYSVRSKWRLCKRPFDQLPPSPQHRKHRRRARLTFPWRTTSAIDWIFQSSHVRCRRICCITRTRSATTVMRCICLKTFSSVNALGSCKRPPRFVARKKAQLFVCLNLLVCLFALSACLPCLFVLFAVHFVCCSFCLLFVYLFAYAFFVFFCFFYFIFFLAFAFAFVYFAC